MNSYLFKLRFTTAVHFGLSDSALSLYSSAETFCADTLFSALCHTALSLRGTDGVEELCKWVREDTLRLSDAMLWRGDTFYLPKPLARSQSTMEVPAADRKVMKKLQWLPVEAFDGFARSLAGGKPFEPRKYAARFGQAVEMTRAHVTDGADTVPYVVGAFVFDEDCGLYILVQCEARRLSWMRTLLQALGLSGIGGKVTSGYGRFTIDAEINLDAPCDMQTEWLNRALNKESPKYLLVTASLPQEKELDDALSGASFALIRRGGFVSSDTYAEMARKKRTQYFLASGSVLAHRFDGDLYEVGCGGAHKVYRYGRPIFLGVNL